MISASPRPNSHARSTRRPIASASSLLASVRSPAMPHCASAISSASIRNSGSICKPSSSSQSQPRKQAKRSVSCRARQVCRYSQSSRDWCRAMKLDALKKRLLERPEIRAEYEAMTYDLKWAEKHALEKDHETSLASNVDRMNFREASECLDASSMLGLLKHYGGR
jgi:hypothetical protein